MLTFAWRDVCRWQMAPVANTEETRYLPDEAARLVTACPERYLMADNPQKKNKRRLYD